MYVSQPITPPTCNVISSLLSVCFCLSVCLFLFVGLFVGLSSWLSDYLDEFWGLNGGISRKNICHVWEGYGSEILSKLISGPARVRKVTIEIQ